MIIRPATPSDIDAVTELGLEALRGHGYEELLVSPTKVRAMAIECISSASNYCWVAEIEGVVVAAVSALIHELMFYERKQATVVQFYTRVPSAGIKLIRAFLKWARGRKIIKMICFTVECKADPRIGTMLTRLGLTSEFPIYLEMR